MAKYDSKTKEKAFKLYCTLDGNAQAVSRNMGIAPLTIYAWRDKYNWEERRLSIATKVDKEVAEVKKRLKLDTLKNREDALKLMINSIWEKIQSGEITPTGQMLVSLFDQLHKMAGDYAPEKVEMLAGIKTIVVKPKLTEEQQNLRDLEEIKRLRKKYGSLDQFCDDNDCD